MKKLFTILFLFLLAGCAIQPAGNLGAKVTTYKFGDFTKTVKSDKADTIKVETKLGKVKLIRWDSASLEVGLIDDKKTNKDVELIELSDGYELNIILKEKPKSNIISYSINSVNLDFFYQPFLKNLNPDGSTWEDNNGDISTRPANVNGSYAVYYKDGKAGDFSKSGGKNYKTGKAFHIYRPEIFDANGIKVWGEMNYNNGILMVTVPQDFLNKAVYPVIVDPTFGYTSIGATAGSWAENTLRINSPYTPIEAGTITEIYYYGSAETTANSMRGVVYASSTLAFVASSSPTLVSTTAGWKYLDLDNTAITAIPYNLGLWIGTEGTGATIYYDTAVGYTVYRNSTAYSATAAPPDPFTYVSVVASRQLSMYANYTCASGTCTDVYSVAGTYSWTAPTGVTSANVACWGGGGGSYILKGGGGGAYAATNNVAVTAGNSYTVVIGSGGSGIAHGATSTFNTTTVVADGGLSNLSGGNPGTGGTVANSTGDIRYAGGDGATSGTYSGGGGGAAGPDGAGNDGTTAGVGGSGDAGFGGAGGAQGPPAGVGGYSVLGGGGGGGGRVDVDAGGNGGGYGGGGGGGGASGSVGASGACEITYTISGAVVSTSAPDDDFEIYDE